LDAEGAPSVPGRGGSRAGGQASWKPDPARSYTLEERASGQELVDVHNALRSELSQIEGLIDQVAAGAMDVASARSAINVMTLRQNNWTR